MSESADIAIATVLSVLCIGNIVGNSLVCIIIMRNREMRYEIEIMMYMCPWADSVIMEFASNNLYC